MEMLNEDSQQRRKNDFIQSIALQASRNESLDRDTNDLVRRLLVDANTAFGNPALQR